MIKKNEQEKLNSAIFWKNLRKIVKTTKDRPYWVHGGHFGIVLNPRNFDSNLTQEEYESYISSSKKKDKENE